VPRPLSGSKRAERPAAGSAEGLYQRWLDFLGVLAYLGKKAGGLPSKVIGDELVLLKMGKVRSGMLTRKLCLDVY